MSYGNSFQSRLGLNFDVAKFGSAIDPFGDLDQRLAKQSNLIRGNTATVYTAIATSNVATSTYFQNPVASAIGPLLSTLASVYSTIWNYNVPIDDGEGGFIPNYILRPLVSGLPATYTSLLEQLTTDDSNPNGTPKDFNTFISHTDRLSNLKQSNKSNRPSFNAAQSILQTVQSLVYQTETTSTTTVGALGLGAFTSLFIISDLTNYRTALNNILTTINALLLPNPTSVTPPISNAISSANTNFVNLLSLLNTRRVHDENFYQNAVSIGQDLNKISANKSVASTSSAVSSYLVDNLIGTTALKNL
jgi:hypothetical protein